MKRSTRHGLKIDSHGNKHYYCNGRLHRNNGPALEIHPYDYKDLFIREWYLHGKRHRLNGPAIERSDGYKAWYQNGKIHRDNGPAIECPDSGSKEWLQYGKLHRLDGPAAEYSTGYKEWWVHGKHIQCHSQEEFLAITNPKLGMFW
jgi:hypothetical protein